MRVCPPHVLCHIVPLRNCSLPLNLRNARRKPPQILTTLCLNIRFERKQGIIIIKSAHKVLKGPKGRHEPDRCLDGILVWPCEDWKAALGQTEKTLDGIASTGVSEVEELLCIMWSAYNWIS